MSGYVPPLLPCAGQWQVRFCLDGLKCLACVRRCKNFIYTQFPKAVAEFDLHNKSASIRFEEPPQGLSSIFAQLRQAGFNPRPYYERAFREDLIQIALAGYVSANVMMMALGDYFAAVDEPFATLFRILSLLLTSLSISVAAKSIFLNAYNGLRAKRIDIDLGIGLGMLAGFSYSAFNTLRGQGEVYYDSVSAVIFLILVGRFFKNRELTRANLKLKETFAADLSYCTRVDVAGAFHRIETLEIQKGDTLLVRAGELLPVRARIQEGRGLCDLASITGEPEALFVKEGEELPAGAYTLDCCLQVEALTAGPESFLPQAERLAETYLAERSLWQGRADRLAKIFVASLLLASATLVIFNVGGSLAESVRRAVAILMVACPCALGFALPLAFGKAVALLSQQQVTVRRWQGFERLNHCGRIFFDKTGTLTQSQLSLDSMHLNPRALGAGGEPQALVQQLGLWAARVSVHPICQAFGQWAAAQKTELSGSSATSLLELGPSSIQEIGGQGLQFVYHGQRVRLGKANFTCDHKAPQTAQVHLAVAGECLASFSLKELLYPDTQATLAKLRQWGFELGIISGDRSAATSALAQQLGISERYCLSEQSPADKAAYVRGFEGKGSRRDPRQLPLMVGNGLNDMLALAGSQVAVAVHGSQPVAIKMADFYLQKPGLAGLLALLSTGKQLQVVLKRISIFSLSYNAVTLIAAGCGFINPLLAAVLMPLSSTLIIFLATQWPKKRESYEYSARAYSS